MIPPTGPTQAVLDAAQVPSTPFTFKPAPPTRVGISDPVFLAASLAQLVDAVTGSDSRGSALRAVGDGAATLIIGAEQAAVVVCADDRQPDDVPDGPAGDVQLLMKAQEDTGEGPCLDAARSGERVLVQDLRSETRWPQFTPRAPWHLHSMLCLPVPVFGGRVGVLTVVSARAWAFDETSARLATVVTAHAALALGLAEKLLNLRAMADSREIIGQATGMLMQRHHLPAEQAFHVLTRASQERNLKLRTLCEQLTGAAPLPGRHSGPAADARRDDPAPDTGGGRPSRQE